MRRTTAITIDRKARGSRVPRAALFLLLIAGGSILAGFLSGSLAAATADDVTSALPRLPAQWLNSPPVTAQMLEGKAVFFWFYEESCPKCTEKWADLLTAARKHEGQPIVFIAVNSGNPPDRVAAYLNRNRVGWPTIVDLDRQFEQVAGVGVISLQNVYQAAILTGDRQWTRVNATDLDASIERALKGARWRVDPSSVPPRLAEAWRAVEFGKYDLAAKPIRKSRQSGDDQEREAADALNAAVMAEMKEQARAAWTLGKEERFFEAYLAFTALEERFQGYEIPDKYTGATKWLFERDDVRNEVQVYKALQSAKALLASPLPQNRSRAVNRLKTIATGHPDTFSATEASRLLDQIGATAPSATSR